MKIHKGIQPRPRRILLYSKHGLGKSTWASKAPRPIFLNLEDGLGDIDCESTEKICSYDELLASLLWLDQNEHPFRTVVIDTLDWAEKLIHQRVCDAAQVKAITDIDFGKGFGRALPLWQTLVGMLNQLRASKNMAVILLAHATAVKIREPGQDQFDRWSPDLHKEACQLFLEWSDEVLFGNVRTFVRSEDQGFGKSRAIAMGGEERYLQTTCTAAAEAKNRLSLPLEIPFQWAAYAEHLTQRIEASGNVSGLVVDGSSKKAK